MCRRELSVGLSVSRGYAAVIWRDRGDQATGEELCLMALAGTSLFSHVPFQV